MPKATLDLMLIAFGRKTYVDLCISLGPWGLFFRATRSNYVSVSDRWMPCGDHRILEDFRKHSLEYGEKRFGRAGFRHDVFLLWPMGQSPLESP